VPPGVPPVVNRIRADHRLVDAWPIHVWTVTGSTPRASQRHAAVCRRSWIRRPSTRSVQPSARLNAEACSRHPREVTKSGSSPRLRPSDGPSAGRGQRPGPGGCGPTSPLRRQALRLGALDDEDRHGHLDEVPDPDGPQL